MSDSLRCRNCETRFRRESLTGGRCSDCHAEHVNEPWNWRRIMAQHGRRPASTTYDLTAREVVETERVDDFGDAAVEYAMAWAKMSQIGPGQPGAAEAERACLDAFDRLAAAPPRRNAATSSPPPVQQSSSGAPEVRTVIEQEET